MLMEPLKELPILVVINHSKHAGGYWNYIALQTKDVITTIDILKLQMQ